MSYHESLKTNEMMDSLEKTTQKEDEVEVIATETSETPETVENHEVQEPTAEETPAADEKAEPQIPLMKTKEEVLARAQEIAAQADGGNKQELELLKQLYYKYHKADMLADMLAFVDAGGAAEDYQPEPDPTEEPFKQAMQQWCRYRNH